MRKVILLFGWLAFISPYQAEAACDPNIPADLSGDCQVDFNDLAIMASDWLKPAVPHEWLARYDGPSNYEDYPRAIAVDSSDNIYVTGYSVGSGTSFDYATVKYSPDSNEAVWVARYNGPGNGGDLPYAITVDRNDNIYVTGRSFGSGTNDDYATIKYSPDSNEPIWVARYNGPGNNNDRAYAIGVDSNENIYVTGRSYGFGTSYDYATIKYSADSNEPVWVARYNGPGNNNDYARAIAIDSNDNIYVTGYSVGSGTSFDYTTIKYSADSNEAVWIARYNGPGSQNDSAYGIIVDSNDNIYVTGRSYGSGTDYDYATIKYSPDSNEPVWVARYNGPGNGYDWAYGIVVDGNDNVYVTGYSYVSSTNDDFVTIKYSSDSNEAVWVARYDGPDNRNDGGEAIGVDSRDNIYVTGLSTYSATLWDYATIKYSPDSNEPVWVARYDGPHNDDDNPAGLAIDSNDNIYVTGRSFRLGTMYDYATIRYSPDYSCTPQITGDFDRNCAVDIYDLAIFCQHWLECNLDPPEDCWQ